MDQPTKPAGFRVDTIILTDSSFNRINDINFEEIPFENRLNIEKDFTNEDDGDTRFTVGLTLHFVAQQQGKVAFEIKVRMVGIFEQQGETPLTRESFKNLNAPAIIYPFIREHVSSLTLKAGIWNVMLPAVSFKV